jgi:hypothetical protein
VKCFVSLQFLNPKTDGRTPWMGNQSVARPLLTQEDTDIYALCGIRTYDHSVQVGEDSPCLTLGYVGIRNTRMYWGCVLPLPMTGK